MILERFDQDEFLRSYWQRKPLLIRHAGAAFVDPVDADELAGLACEEAVESRIVSHHTDNDWQLSHGPFDSDTFAQLGERNWTLLVQAVDLIDPDVALLKKHFNFLPSWRIDDIMVSYASAGGGVGPHYDQYDVFLIQGRGSRRWQIGDRCDSSTPLRQNTELRLLQEFNSQQEIVLEPGDVLYLPPRFAHYGTALQDSLCYSVGFRAPSYAELLQGYSEELAMTMCEDLRFEDPAPFDWSEGGVINERSVNIAFDKLREATDQKHRLVDFFGKHVTEPRYPERIQPEEISPGADDLQELATKTNPPLTYQKNPNSRFAYFTDQQGLRLFVDGEQFDCQPRQLSLVKKLCSSCWPERPEIQQLLLSKQDYALIADLISQASLSLEAD
jgi:50S ribosomal protein L16 3-hydroxylase